MPHVASFFFGLLPQEDLITVLLSSDCVRSTELILFQMKGFTAAKILGGQLRRWGVIWADRASLLLVLRGAPGCTPASPAFLPQLVAEHSDEIAVAILCLCEQAYV